MNIDNVKNGTPKTPEELVEYVSRAFGIEAAIPTSDGWVELLSNAGLRDLIAKPYTVNILREWFDEIGWLDIREVGHAWWDVLSLYLNNPAFRDYMKKMKPPRSVRKIFDYFGYGIYVGRK